METKEDLIEKLEASLADIKRVTGDYEKGLQRIKDRIKKNEVVKNDVQEMLDILKKLSGLVDKHEKIA